MTDDITLDELDRAALVARAKDYELPATGKTDEIRERVREYETAIQADPPEDPEGAIDVASDEGDYSDGEIADDLRNASDEDLRQIQRLVNDEVARRVRAGAATVASINTAEARERTEIIGDLASDEEEGEDKVLLRRPVTRVTSQAWWDPFSDHSTMFPSETCPATGTRLVRLGDELYAELAVLEADAERYTA